MIRLDNVALTVAGETSTGVWDQIREQIAEVLVMLQRMA